MWNWKGRDYYNSKEVVSDFSVKTYYCISGAKKSTSLDKIMAYKQFLLTLFQIWWALSKISKCILFDYELSMYFNKTFRISLTAEEKILFKQKVFQTRQRSFVCFIKVFVVNILNIICKFVLLSPSRQIRKYAMIGYNSLKCFYMIM